MKVLFKNSGRINMANSSFHWCVIVYKVTEEVQNLFPSIINVAC